MSEHPGISQPQWYSLMVLFITMILLAAGNVFYTNHVSEQSRAADRAARLESERKFCTVVVTITGRENRQPPTTAYGKELAAAMERLRDDLNCPKPK